QRHARAGDERAAGLEDELDRRQLVQRPRALELPDEAADELADRERGLLGNVAGAEAAAEVDHARRPAELPPPSCREAVEPAHGHERRTEVEQLRPDVRVQPEALRKSPDRVDRIVWRKPELRPVVCRLDGLVRVRLDPGRYPDEATRRTERARPLELVERV